MHGLKIYMLHADLLYTKIAHELYAMSVSGSGLVMNQATHEMMDLKCLCKVLGREYIGPRFCDETMVSQVIYDY